MNIEEKLKQLKEFDKILEKAVGDFEAERQELISGAMPAGFKEELDEFDNIHSAVIDQFRQRVSDLETKIKIATLKNGESTKNEIINYQVVFSKGKTTWDTKALNGYALAHPEINELRRTGKPSASIRRGK